MDYRAARDYAHNLRLRIYGKTRAELAREVSAREAELLQTRTELDTAIESLLRAEGQIRSQNDQLLELRTTNSILRRAEAARAKEASDARAAQAFSGFLSTELQSQVQIQRQMMAQTDKAFEALVNADVTTRDRPGPPICKCAARAGEISGTLPANPIPVAGCASGDTPKGRRCCGAHRKAGKNTGTARRVRGKA